MPSILSKNNRVLALIGALALASFVVGGIVYAVSTDQAHELAAMSTRISRLDALANTMSTEVNHAEDALGDYVLSGDAIARTRFDGALTNQAAAADDFRAVAAGMEPVQSALARLEVASLDWRDRIARTSTRSNAYWGGVAKRSSSAGARALITFTGRSIAWVARKGPSYGKATLYVNGVCGSRR